MVYILLFKDPRSCVTVHGKTPLQIRFIYVGNMEIYRLCQTLCKTSVLFSTNCCSVHNFIIFSTSNTFPINCVLNPSRVKVKIWALIFYTPHINLSDFKPEGFDSFTYLRSVLNSENNG